MATISIHAPLTGSDVQGFPFDYRHQNFNPRSPYGERRSKATTGTVSVGDFNPRSPYGERLTKPTRQARLQHFNPRSPYGERLRQLAQKSPPTKFQSTLPLRGATQTVCQPGQQAQFQSTLPLRGATKLRSNGGLKRGISIHAPLTGSDFSTGLEAVCDAYFNPRSPYGERLLCVASTWSALNFNPRSPYGERLAFLFLYHFLTRFQSTLPLRGATG